MILFVWFFLGIIALALFSVGWARLGERMRERDAVGVQFTLQSTIDNKPLDIDPALHRTPALYRRASR